MKRILISVILIFSTLLFYSSYASSYNFTASPNEANVEPGDEILITLNVSDIDAGVDGINVVETTLQYDNSIIDSISFVEKNNWKSTYNSNEGNLQGKLLYTKMVSGITNSEDIGILSIKIKDTIKTSFTTEIKLLQVTSNDGYTLMNAGDKTITLTYIAPETPDDNNPVTPNPSTNPNSPSNNPDTTPTPDSKEQNTLGTKETKDDKSSNSSSQTGDIISLVGVLLVACILSYLMIVFIIIKRDDDDEEEKDKDKKEENKQ